MDLGFEKGMGDSTWHLIEFNVEVGSTYVRDVPGGAIYMVKTGEFVPKTRVGYVEFGHGLVTSTEWEDHPPRLVFVPGASVAIELERIRVSRETADANRESIAKGVKELSLTVVFMGGRILAERDETLLANLSDNFHNSFMPREVGSLGGYRFAYRGRKFLARPIPGDGLWMVGLTSEE